MLSVLRVISSFKSKVPRGCNVVLLVKIKQITSSPRLVKSRFGGTSSEWSAAGIILNITSCWTRTRWLINWLQMTFCCSGSLGSHWGVTSGGARAGLLCFYIFMAGIHVTGRSVDYVQCFEADAVGSVLLFTEPCLCLPDWHALRPRTAKVD